MSCIARLSQTLRARGFRMTPQRLIILQVLHDGGHLSPVQIYERVCRLMPGMTETTIYRTLEFLAGNGAIFSANAGNGHLAYELADASHHHLVCRSCGAQMDVEHDLLQGLIGSLETHTGYRLDAGHLTFFGLCPQCQPESDVS